MRVNRAPFSGVPGDPLRGTRGVAGTEPPTRGTLGVVGTEPRPGGHGDDTLPGICVPLYEVLPSTCDTRVTPVGAGDPTMGDAQRLRGRGTPPLGAVVEVFVLAKE